MHLHKITTEAQQDNAGWYDQHAIRDFSLIIFFKIAKLCENQFTKKLICDFTSKSIFTIIQPIEDYFKAILIIYELYIHY